MIQLYWICKLHLSAGGGSYPQVNMTWHANCSDITPVPAGVGEKLTGLQQGEFCTSNRNGGNREAGMLPGRFDRINISQPPIGRCGSFGDAIKLVGKYVKAFSASVYHENISEKESNAPKISFIDAEHHIGLLFSPGSQRPRQGV